MTLYLYTAKNKEGQTVRGQINALSMQLARDALMEIKLFPEEIHEAQFVQDGIQQKSSVDALQEVNPASNSSEEALISENKHAIWESSDGKNYFPLLDTLRLYAGWLLAWYCLIYILGLYQQSKPLPFRIPYVQALLLSPIVLTFTLASFLFLLGTTLQKLIHKGKISGSLISIVGVVIFLLYRINVE